MIEPVDASRKQGHALVLDIPCVERMDRKLVKVGGIEQLRQDAEAVVRGVRAVVMRAAIILDEAGEADVFNAA